MGAGHDRMMGAAGPCAKLSVVDLGSMREPVGLRMQEGILTHQGSLELMDEEDGTAEVG
jgi:hypothetical protein